MRYRRSKISGATYFFTLVLEKRRPLFENATTVALFQTAMAEVRQGHPFNLEAQVILPDHLHSMWSLPAGEADFSKRWRLIKSRFTRAYLRRYGAFPVCASRQAKREQGVWQRRFWEHLIRDEADFIAHLNYIHYNPVRHGLVAAPADWPHSTFRDWVERGAYELHWGGGDMPELPSCAGRE